MGLSNLRLQCYLDLCTSVTKVYLQGLSTTLAFNTNEFILQKQQFITFGLLF